MNRENPAASPSPSAVAQTSQPAPAGYHPLALDSRATGLWGWVDRTSDRVSRWLNPILIKEARQALKSRQFTITFFLLLFASWGWTIMGATLQSPDIYHVPSGTFMLAGYYFVLAVPMLAMVPLAAHRSLASEIDDGTFEMLSITRLSALGIVMGKLNSAVLQMMVYFAALVPCLAFSYLLRGVAFPTIILLIGTIFYAAMLLTTFSLLFATLTANRAGQIFALLAVVAVVIFAEFLCGTFCMVAVLGEQLTMDSEGLSVTAIFLIGGISFMVLFVKAAAAKIAPITENRSTGLRWIMFAQQLIWVGSLATVALWYDDTDPLNFASMIVTGYWLLMGTIMLSESPYLSPRVQRDLPRTFFGRMMLTWFNPGPGTGFMFAISTGTVGIAILAFVGLFIRDASPTTFPLSFAAMSSGYLMFFLGITRLLSMPMMHRFGRTMAFPIATLAIVMMLAVMVPSIVTVVVTGRLAPSYQITEATNWFWTLIHAFDRGPGLSPEVSLLIFLMGSSVFFVNLI
ncbi:MAG: hypothetical protein WD119_02580, partial [Pirellulaceae bacterium]